MVVFNFKTVHKYQCGVALLDSGAAISVCSDSFVRKWNFETKNGPKVKLTGFNNVSSYTDRYVKMKLFDHTLKFFVEKCFLILKNLAMDVLIGFDCLKNFTMITEDDFMVLETHADSWIFKRNKPKTKISIQNRYLPPGRSILNVSLSGHITCGILKVMNHDYVEGFNADYVVSKERKLLQIPVMNVSNKIIFSNLDQICKLDEINDKILKLNEPIPPHHRRGKKLPKLNLNELNVNPKAGERNIQKLKHLLKRYHYCFSRSASDIGTYSGNIKYDIVLLNEIKETYKGKIFNGHERNFIRKELKSLLDNGIVCKYPTTRTFCGLTLALKKSPEGEKLRLCMNSQIINKNTAVAQNFELPDLQKQVESLSNRRFYCRFDLRSAYWQVKLPMKQVGLYSFSFENETYTWLRSSFGTKGMSATFSYIMESVFGSIPNCIIYMDDLSIHNETIEEQLKTISQVLEKCSEYGLTFNLPKCCFFVTEIKAFGFIINWEGNRPDPEKVRSLLKIELPTTLKKLQSALGGLNYYNRCIPKFKHYASCFYDLTSNYKYDPSMKHKWKRLLNCVANVILRHRPNYDDVLYISTDSSDTAGGATFYQKSGNEVKLLMVDSLRHYGRWLLAKPSHKEFSILYSMLKKHRKFITLFHKIHLVCDNAVVFALLSNINSVRILTKSVPARWLAYVSLFNFEISHSKGDDLKFVLTDLLSRSQAPHYEKGYFTLGNLKDEEALVWRSDVKNKYAIYSSSFTEYLKPLDSEYIRNEIKVRQFKSGFDDSRPNVRTRTENVEIDGKMKKIEIKYLRSKLLVPSEFMNELLTLTHNHQSPHVQYQLLQNMNIETKFLHKRVFDFYKSCVICQTQHKKKSSFRRTSVNVSDDIGEVGHVDVLHLNGFKFLNLIDHFSGYIWCEMIENKTEKVVCEKLMKIIFASGFLFGTIVTDNHVSFKGKLLMDFAESLNIRLVHSASRNPQGNSKIESAQRLIVKQVKLMQNLEIPLWLIYQMSVFVLNNTENRIHGLSPFECIYLRENRFPTNIPSLSMSKLRSFKPATSEFYRTAIEILSRVKLRQLENLRNVENFKMYEKGDVVLMKNYRISGKSDKLLPAYSSKPFVIIHKNVHTKTYLTSGNNADLYNQVLIDLSSRENEAILAHEVANENLKTIDNSLSRRLLTFMLTYETGDLPADEIILKDFVALAKEDSNDSYDSNSDSSDENSSSSEMTLNDRKRDRAQKPERLSDSCSIALSTDENLSIGGSGGSYKRTRLSGSTPDFFNTEPFVTKNFTSRRFENLQSTCSIGYQGTVPKLTKLMLNSEILEEHFDLFPNQIISLLIIDRSGAYPHRYGSSFRLVVNIKAVTRVKSFTPYELFAIVVKTHNFESLEKNITRMFVKFPSNENYSIVLSDKPLKFSNHMSYILNLDPIEFDSRRGQMLNLLANTSEKIFLSSVISQSKPLKTIKSKA